MDGAQARMQKCGLGGRVPKALEWRRRRRRRGCGLGGGIPLPSPVGVESGEGAVTVVPWYRSGDGAQARIQKCGLAVECQTAPSPEKFWHFLLRNGAF